MSSCTLTWRNYDESNGTSKQARPTSGGGEGKERGGGWVCHATRNTFALKCNLFSLLHAHNATHSTPTHTQTGEGILDVYRGRVRAREKERADGVEIYVEHSCNAFRRRQVARKNYVAREMLQQIRCSNVRVRWRTECREREGEGVGDILLQRVHN